MRQILFQIYGKTTLNLWYLGSPQSEPMYGIPLIALGNPEEMLLQKGVTALLIR